MDASRPRVAIVCADRGIPWFGDGGASAHLRGIAGGYGAAGCAVEAWVRTLGPAGIDVPGVRVFEGPARGFDGWVGRMLSERAPDLVHQRHALDVGVPLRGTRPRRWVLEVNAPLVWEGALFRGAEASRRRLARERATFAAADEVIAVSEGLAAWIGPRARVVPNGVAAWELVADGGAALEDAVAVESPGVDAPFVLGYEGTFKPWHGLVAEVARLPELAAQVGSLRVDLAGDGPERAPVLAALARHGIDHAWLGVLGRRALARARRGWSASWSPEAPWPPAGATSVAQALGEPVPDRWFAPLKEANAAAAGLPLWKGGALRAPAPPPPTWEDIAADLLAHAGLVASGGRCAAPVVG